MEKKNKKSIVIGLSILFVVALIILGITYAYYRTRIIDNPNEESISVTSKKLEITYRDGSAYFISGVTGVESEIAGGVKDKIEPGDSFKKVFSVENTGDGTAKFGIKLDNIETTFERMQDWTYTLSGGNLSEPITGQISTSDAYIVKSISIDTNETQNYTLVITYANSDEDQSDDMGASLKLRVNIADEGEETYTIDNAPSGTLLYALKNNFPSGTGETRPGYEVNLATEARVVEVEDDYGTSYMYRGNVENNFVTYANKCWRIVRVQGDGGIKLILADGNSPCSGGTYSLDNELSGVLINEDNVSKSLFPFSPYGTSHSSSDDIKFSDSLLLQALNSWANGGSITFADASQGLLELSGSFEPHLTVNDLNKLEEAEWCNDIALVYSELGGIEGSLSFNRFMANEDPVLKCDSEFIYKSKIGLLTADEAAYAGAVENSRQTNYDHTNYYLVQNGKYFWTMTESLFFEHYSVNSSNLNREQSSGSYAYIRPVVVLKSNVKATIDSSSTYAPGTHQNPYVIS